MFLEPCYMLCSLCEKAILKLISMKIWLLIFTEKSLSCIYNKEFKVKLSSGVKFCDLDTELFLDDFCMKVCVVMARQKQKSSLRVVPRHYNLRFSFAC